MVSSSIDHMVALTIFIAATLLFIGLFNQTIQTAVVYQNHRAIATEASDLLDTILLNPGIPNNWGRTTETPIGFGLQDPEFTQYKLDTFSLMRLSASTGDPVYYSKTNGGSGMSYNNLSTGFGSYLLMPQDSVLDYSSASKLLGINGSYGFQLTLKPIVTVAVSEIQPSESLKLSIHVEGIGFPLAYASVSYKLYLLSLANGQYPCYRVINNTITTNGEGSSILNFTGVPSDANYAFVASAHLSGLNGVGYHIHSPLQSQHIIPLIGNLSSNKIILSHSGDIDSNQAETTVTYNTTMVTFNSEDFTLQEVQLNNTGAVTNGAGYPYSEIALTNEPGVLIIAYNYTSSDGGFVAMPWGLSSLGFEVTFGGDPANQEWVSTDMRQVTINGVAYQARLAIWSYKGYQVNG